jgi:hypothetical protein
LSGIWRGASFSLKFATVILVAGVAIAAVTLMLAEASARAQAESSAADSVSIAASLIDGQRASLTTFIRSRPPGRCRPRRDRPGCGAGDPR